MTARQHAEVQAQAANFALALASNNKGTQAIMGQDGAIKIFKGQDEMDEEETEEAWRVTRDAASWAARALVSEAPCADEAFGEAAFFESLAERLLARVEGQTFGVRLGEGTAGAVEAHVARPAPVHRDVGVGALFRSWYTLKLHARRPGPHGEGIVYLIQHTLPR